MGANLFLLKLLAIYYPIAVAVQAQLRKPIAVVVPDATLMQYVIDSLGGKSNIIHECCSLEDTVNKLKKASIFPVIIIGRNSESIPERLERQWRVAIDAARLSEVSGKPLATQIIFLFDRRIPPQYSDMFFRIYLDADCCKMVCPELNLERYIGACLDSRLFKNEVLGNLDYENDASKAFDFVIALAKLFKEDFDSLELEDAARQLITYDEEVEDIGDVSDLFRQLLYDLAENKRFSAIFELPKLERNVIDLLDEGLFFDSNYLYISDKLFRKITATMRDIYPLDIIKNGLSDETILIGGKSRYAVKMTYVTPFGESRRACMLRFSREKLNRIGEMDLVDIFVSNKEDMKCQVYD